VKGSKAGEIVPCLRSTRRDHHMVISFPRPTGRWCRPVLPVAFATGRLWRVGGVSLRSDTPSFLLGAVRVVLGTRPVVEWRKWRVRGDQRRSTSQDMSQELGSWLRGSFRILSGGKKTSKVLKICIRIEYGLHVSLS